MQNPELPFNTEIEEETALNVLRAESSLRNPEWLLALTNLEGIGNKKALSLIQRFESYDELMRSPEEEIRKVIGKNQIDFSRLEKVDVRQPNDVKLVTYFDQNYPVGLRELSDAPLTLWYRGVIPSARSIAIVGTRNPDNWGRTASQRMAEMCGTAGFAVISGLALGIDAEAHIGCLKTKSPTVAVLASDVRFPTPISNSKLASEILEKGGCLIAEKPMGTETNSSGLVARNRLQAAWAQSIIVPQCGIPSGTLHTVRFGLELGRKLIVLNPPAPFNESHYEGNIRLTQKSPGDFQFLGGTKKFQESIKNRTRIADLSVNSIEDFESFLNHA